MNFAGIEFEENDGGGIEIINIKWLTPRKKEIFWPPFKTNKQFHRALTRGDSPEEGEWKLYSIKRFFFENVNYTEAEKKIKQAKITSDLDTDTQDTQAEIGKRKRFPRRLSFSDDDSEESPRVGTKNKAPPHINYENFLSAQSEPSTQAHPRESLALRDTLISKLFSQRESLLASQEVAGPSSCPTVHTSGSQGALPDVQNNHVLKVLMSVKEQTSEILNWIRKQNSASNVIPNQLPEDVPVSFPITTLDDIVIFENYLNYNENLLAICKYLSTVGGRDLTGRVNSILKKLMCNEVAVNYSFFGSRSNKRAFYDLKLKVLVIRAIQITSPGVTEKDICTQIKVWLKHAPQRVQNENKRRRIN
ncbi:unnamed protein product [Brassicogethes aeneus]|uniref:DUF4806 domain-containing protein n=1 Tax=Brassicogethes aeneus TaxID=1431903 RepID=A0A9P0B8H3_BRAAE|nr:unnamed protein product [Brassicogethes aeneus]